MHFVPWLVQNLILLKERFINELEQKYRSINSISEKIKSFIGCCFESTLLFIDTDTPIYELQQNEASRTNALSGASEFVATLLSPSFLQLPFSILCTFSCPHLTLMMIVILLLMVMLLVMMKVIVMIAAVIMVILMIIFTNDLMTVIIMIAMIILRIVIVMIFITVEPHYVGFSRKTGNWSKLTNARVN